MEDGKLDMLLTAQVLILAKQIKAEKAAKGATTTSDMVDDALMLIQQNKSRILSAIR